MKFQNCGMMNCMRRPCLPPRLSPGGVLRVFAAEQVSRPLAPSQSLSCLFNPSEFAYFSAKLVLSVCGRFIRQYLSFFRKAFYLKFRETDISFSWLKVFYFLSSPFYVEVDKWLCLDCAYHGVADF